MNVIGRRSTCARRSRRGAISLIVALVASTGAPAAAQTPEYALAFTRSEVARWTIVASPAPTDRTATVAATPALVPGLQIQIQIPCTALPPGFCAGPPNFRSFAARLETANAVTGAVTFSTLPFTPAAGSQIISSLFAPKNGSVDSTNGDLYVIDSYNHRIVVFDKTGALVRTFGSYGQVFALDADDAPDPGGDCIDILDPGRIMHDACPNDPWQMTDRFRYPYDIAVDGAAGLVYVADTENHRIQVFNKTTFAHVRTIGTYGLGDEITPAGPGQFAWPQGLAVGAGGRIVVADAGNAQIAVLDPNPGGPIVASDSTRYSQFRFGHFGEGDTGFGTALSDPFAFDNLMDVAVDPTDGRIVVADMFNYRMQIYSATGSFITAIGQTGSTGSAVPGVFNQPAGVTVDNTGRVWVADTFNHRVQVFDKSGSTYPFAFTFGALQDTPAPVPGVVGLIDPTGVVHTPDGNVGVIQQNGHRFQLFALSSLAIDAIAAAPAQVIVDERVTVDVTVKNTGLVLISGVVPTLTSNIGAVALGSIAPGSAVLAPGDSQVFTQTFQATAVGNLTFIASATGVAAPPPPPGGGACVSCPHPSAAPVTLNPAIVVKPTPAPHSSTSLTVTPGTSSPNDTIVAVVTVANTGGVELTGITPSLSFTTASGATLQPICADIPSTPATWCPGSSVATSAPEGGSVQFVFKYQPGLNAPPQGTATFTAASTNDQNAPSTATPVTVTIVADNIAPAFSAPSRPATNALGWNNTPAPPNPIGVVVTLHATDNAGGSGIGRVDYRVEGAQGFVGGVVAPPNTTTLNVPIVITAQGLSTIKFWATDRAGNAQATPGLLPCQFVDPTTQQTVTPYPNQCFEVKYDYTAPDLRAETRPNPNPDGWNSSAVTVIFIGTDAFSGVSSLTAPVVIGPVPNAGTGVAGTAIDGAGNVTSMQEVIRIRNGAPEVIQIKIDPTPPEGFNQFDVATKDNVVIARDVGPVQSGGVFGAAPVAPVSVAPVSWGNDDDADDDAHGGGNAELRTYKLADKAGNVVTLVETFKRSGKEMQVRVMSVQYTSFTSVTQPDGSVTVAPVAGPVIKPLAATKKFEWSLERNGALKELNQKMEIGRGPQRRQVHAKYDAKKNTTTIQEQGPGPGKSITVTGLRLLRMVTVKPVGTTPGGVIIEY